MLRFRSTAVALAAAATLSLTAGSAAAQHTPLPDAQIKQMVEHELEKRDEFRNITVEVLGGTVTLRGTVPSIWAKEEAIDEVRDVEDVETVVSQLTIPSAESEQMIGQEVAAKIRNYVFYTIFDHVDIAVNGGVVTLTGKVSQPFRAHEIARMAARVPGVARVENQIEVLPASIFDDQIRASLASQIYNDPMFDRYAVQPNPPIHIIVENGNVTLTGVVNSELERTRAEHIARGTFGVFKVENNLRLDREVEVTQR